MSDNLTDASDKASAIDASWRKQMHVTLRYAVDEHLADGVALEARPVIDALVEAWRLQTDHSADRLEHREAYAFMNLLGRRMADQKIPAAPSTEAATLLVDAARDHGIGLTRKMEQGLLSVFFEGFTRSIEDKMGEILDERLALGISIVPLAPRVLLVPLAGELSLDAIVSFADRLGRELLRHDAVAVVLDVGELRAPTADAAAEVLNLHSVARIVGASAYFARVPSSFLDQARTTGINLELLETCPTFDVAVERALGAAGTRLGARFPLKQVLARLGAGATWIAKK